MSTPAPRKVLVIFGTRPEAIKMAPVVQELANYPQRITCVICVTAQYRFLLDPVLELFHIRPHVDLDIMQEDQTLTYLTQQVVAQVGQVLDREHPDLVLVQGDTTTAIVSSLAQRHPDLLVLFPVHPSPAVRKTVHGLLQGHPQIALLEPLDYGAFVHLMAQAYLILTDSGGIQEEGPALGKPVLVLRDNTERPEGVALGVAKLVGTDPAVIQREVERLLGDSRAYAAMARQANPYGDGKAAQRIVSILLQQWSDAGGRDP